MKPYSIELREKIVKVYEQGDTSIIKLATRFDVSKGFVQKKLKQKQTTGHVQPRKQGVSPKSVLNSRRTELIPMVEKKWRASLSEYCEYWLMNYKEAISPSLMCCELKKQNLTRKKRPYAVVSLLLKECKFIGVNFGKK